MVNVPAAMAPRPKRASNGRGVAVCGRRLLALLLPVPDELPAVWPD